MTKSQKIARLQELGITEDLTKKTAAELDALLAENDDSPAAEAAVSPTGADPRTGKLIEVRIEFSSEPGGREDVFAGVNGHVFNAKRGQWIELDEGFVRHLEGTEITDVEPVLRDGKPTGETILVDRSRYQVTRKHR